MDRSRKFERDGLMVDDIADLFEAAKAADAAKKG